ncbi:hypothetical protein ABT187_15310 [Streptomyces sp. NPDC001817]|uniref:hypothetical protein n=1 Tax=Streptomyces sp. NPDC001817 TaxID=3154398 RepID=UPI00332E4ACF
MRKLILMRNVGAAGAAAAMAAGALLAGGSPAAAAHGATGQRAVGATALPTGHGGHRHRGLQCMDPWVAGQLARFDPAARHRLAVFDPWIKDQLTRYTSPSC